MISDDDLMELLIFKGGSAIDMIYDVSGRASLDLDFSMEGGLTEEEEKEVGEKIKKSLQETFLENGYIAFDIKFEKRPRNLRDEVKGFWGGYQVLFKAISTEDAAKYDHDIDVIRRRALNVGAKGGTQFKIDISSYEYCAAKATMELEDYAIHVYSPEMLVFEKLRAICQQIPEYETIIKTNRKPRGRDFYDIHLLMEEFGIDPGKEGNKDLIKGIFEAKKVPLEWIRKIQDYREYHRENFEASLRDTVTKEEELENFDFYFDFVLDSFEKLEF
jgi:predicted nucleotidyltransferase component of viral defense system